MKQFRDTNYYVTKCGNVFSKKSTGLKRMKLCNDNYGYQILTLSINKERKQYKVHRLVGECYILNPNNLPQINHLNGVKHDNRVENLEWINQSNNQKHAYSIGLQKLGQEHSRAKITDEEVDWIRKNYIPRHSKFNSIALAKKFNVGHSQILRIVKNKNRITLCQEVKQEEAVKNTTRE